ncbi:MAG: RnfH family protein [Alcaligenaceae bacterium]|nr:RnfH family protein [Alcaligenaceae bacterium]
MATVELNISVYFPVSPNHVWRTNLSVPPGTTIAQAIDLCGMANEFPDIDIATLGMGIFGIKQPPGHVVSDGDRIELYRKLVFDPKESRRRRAEHRKAGILKKKHLKPNRKRSISYTEYKD